MPRRIRPRPLALLGVLGLLAAHATLLGCGVADGDAERPAPAPSWHQTHRVEPAPGWTVTQRNVDLTEESTSLSGPEGKGCLVRTWPGEPETFFLPTSEATVEVQGVQGSYGPLDPDYGPYPRTVVWQDLSRRWVGVSCDLDRAGILAVAERVRFGPHPMRVPFRLSAAPPELPLVALIESYHPHQAAALFEASDKSRRLTMQISDVVDRSSLSTGQPGQPLQHVTVGGRRVEIRAGSQTICFPTRSHPVCISGPGDEPASDWSPAARELALQTAALLTPVEDPDDDTSWLDADEALSP